MSSATVIDASGQKTGERDLPEGLFGGSINSAVLHQVIVAQLAAARSGSASTKTRSEVRGGGQKPWRQKGTGRARHGSIRSPLWVGGGAVFGPKPRRYTQRLPKKMRKSALRSALAAKAGDGRVWILGGFEEPKTRVAAAVLAAAEIEGRVLIVLDPDDSGSVLIDRAFRNLATAAFSLYGSLSAYDVVVADAVVFTESAFEAYTAVAKEPRVKEDDFVIEREGDQR
jgi:large subunit ribosomal protein L4